MSLDNAQPDGNQKSHKAGGGCARLVALPCACGRLQISLQNPKQLRKNVKAYTPNYIVLSFLGVGCFPVVGAPHIAIVHIPTRLVFANIV